jgi:hypothetical protein
MSDEKIRKLWKDFISEYKTYFLSIEEEWKLNLEWVKKYINENNKRPSHSDKNIRTYYKWINQQIMNYKNKNKIMLNETIRKLWEDFISEYKDHFK